jgi:hypothetical protein
MRPEHLSDSPRPSRRTSIIVGAVLGVLLLLGTAAGIGYLAGVFDEKSKFAAAPAPCTVVEPGLHLLGTGFTTQPDAATCQVMRSDPNTRTVMRISFKAASSPDEAGTVLRKNATGEAAEVAGLGDEAFRKGPLTVFRVSNLMVLCIVTSTRADMGDIGTTDTKVNIFEADLAARLAG